MAFIKLLSDIFVPIIPALVAGGLLMALNNFLTSPGPRLLEVGLVNIGTSLVYMFLKLTTNTKLSQF